jgi:uncharacterized protein DUF4158
MRQQWETEDLIDQWTLHAEERALLGNKTGATRLGFAVLLKYFQRTGRFPQHKNEVPGIVITYLATQVEVDPAAYLQYDWQGRTFNILNLLNQIGSRASFARPIAVLKHVCMRPLQAASMKGCKLLWTPYLLKRLH